jgi:hypothetical protein
MVLLVNIVLYPLGYFFWWATALAAGGATNGLGPHYYVPVFVPLLVLAADGLSRLSQPRLAASLAVGAAMVVVTAINVPDKIDSQRYVTERFQAVARAIPDDLDNALVFVASDRIANFTALEYPFLLNPPHLDGPVLFPVDRHGENGLLIRALPHRRAYLLHRELRRGDPLLRPRWILTRLRAESGTEISLGVRVRSPVPSAVAFASVDGRKTPAVPLGPGPGGFGVELAARATLGSDGRPRVGLSPGGHDVTLGLERVDTGERWQRRYRVFVEADGVITVVRPGLSQHVVRFGRGPATLNEDVSEFVGDVG